MIQSKTDNGALRLVAEADFTIEHAQALQQQLKSQIEAHTGEPVVLDLSAIHFMDSVGVKLVVGLFKSCQLKSLPLTVEVASGQILRLLNLCKLSQMLTVKEVQLNG